MSQPSPRERDQQILELLDGNLSDLHQAELRLWLDASPEHYDRFVELSFIHSQLAEQINSQHSSDDVRLESLQSPSFEQDIELPPIHIDAEALTRQKYVSALSYVLRHTFTPKRIAVLATAAAVLLGIALMIVVLTGPDTTEPIAEQPANPNGSELLTPEMPPAASIVATLSAEQDAQWLEGTFATGTALQANQQLTLTAGLAEITTMHGAVAVLEAPCRIRLTEHGNQVFLQQGQLAAYVPPSATGFIVETLNAKFVDVGTEFAVAVTRDGQSVAKVFRGEIWAGARNTSSEVPDRFESLLANQTCRIDAEGTKIDVDVPLQVALSQPTELIEQIRDSGLEQLVVTTSPEMPSVDTHDIAQLQGGNRLSAPNDPADPGETGDEANWVFGLDRPAQGQTFTTGSNPAGYTLSSLTLQCAADGHYSGAYANQTHIRYRLRVHELDESTQLGSKLLDRFATVRDAAPVMDKNQQNTLTHPTAGQYVTFSGFAVRLQPNTQYAIDLCVVSGSDIGWRLNASTNPNSYRGGNAYSSGDNGTPNQKAITRSGDRAFHLDLAPAREGGQSP